MYTTQGIRIDTVVIYEYNIVGGERVCIDCSRKSLTTHPAFGMARRPNRARLDIQTHRGQRNARLYADGMHQPTLDC